MMKTVMLLNICVKTDKLWLFDIQSQLPFYYDFRGKGCFIYSIYYPDTSGVQCRWSTNLYSENERQVI